MNLNNLKNEYEYSDEKQQAIMGFVDEKEIEAANIIMNSLKGFTVLHATSILRRCTDLLQLATFNDKVTVE